jgi:glycosyltransferase involved in cell wall biosynthesis
MITLDVSPAVNGKAGLGRYAAALAEALAAEHTDSMGLFANFAGATSALSLPDLPLRRVSLGYKPWRMAVLMGHVMGLGFDDLIRGSEVFHASEHLLLPLRHTPSVLTVHDVIYALYPQHHKKLNTWYLNFAMPMYVRRADHIIAISQSTKRDVMRLYHVPEEKISVIYEAAAPHFQPQTAEQIERVRRKFSLPEKYLLAVGTLEPRKNLPRLVQALATLRRDDPALRLVVVGSKGWLYDEFFRAIEAFDQREAVIVPGFVPDADLPAMYAGAAACVMASLYEGFGLPVLEAMACGTPVACSDTSSLGEIAGGAALTFDPESVEEITAALRRLLADSGLRDDLRQRGLAQAGTFSWGRAAAETWAVYQRIRRS